MKYKYQIKVINFKQKKDYVVRKLPQTKQFESLSELCGVVASVLKCPEVKRIGFVEPGHGLKGKQHWLNDDDDLDEMYQNFRSRCVLFWCFDPQSAAGSSQSQGRTKRPLEDPGEKPPAKTKRDVCSQKIREVEAIVKKLEENHGSKFSIEQLNAWGHMLHIEKHSSYDNPPDLPYFTGSKKKQKEVVAAHTPVVSNETWSPRKRVNLRSECINQLDKWHSLLEKGVISQQQFDDLQKTILKDIFENA